MRNIERAERADTALTVYSREGLGEGQDPDLDTVRDFIQDLFHWQKQRDPRGDTEASLREAFEAAARDWPNEWAGRKYD